MLCDLVGRAGGGVCCEITSLIGGGEWNLGFILLGGSQFAWAGCPRRAYVWETLGGIK